MSDESFRPYSPYHEYWFQPFSPSARTAVKIGQGYLLCFLQYSTYPPACCFTHAIARFWISIFFTVVRVDIGGVIQLRLNIVQISCCLQTGRADCQTRGKGRRCLIWRCRPDHLVLSVKKWKLKAGSTESCFFAFLVRFLPRKPCLTFRKRFLRSLSSGFVFLSESGLGLSIWSPEGFLGKFYETTSRNLSSKHTNMCT